MRITELKFGSDVKEMCVKMSCVISCDISGGDQDCQERSALGHDDVMTTGHDMEMLFALLAICEGNPGGFPSQRASDAELWCFLCC